MRRRSHPISYAAVMRQRDVRGTDHAVLRWLERLHGIDVEFFRNEIEGIAARPPLWAAARLGGMASSTSSGMA